MRIRLLAGIVVCTASLVVLALPAASSAYGQSTSPSADKPSATKTSPGITASLKRLQEQGSRECVQPPADLNMKTVSNAELALYGLPDHAVMDSNRALWTRLLANYHHRSCGTRAAPRGAHYHFTTGYGQNWAGNWDYGARGTFRAASVTYYIPSVTCCNDYAEVGFWAGVGGQGLRTSPLSLVQAGMATIIEPTYRFNWAWYEVVNPSCDLNDCNPVNLDLPDMYPGAEITIIVSSNIDNDGYDYFDVCNNTYGYCESAFDYTTDDFSDSATGECIGEEPSLVDGLYADFGTEEVYGCDVYDDGTAYPIGSLTHDYSYLNCYAYDDECISLGYTLVAVGAITDGGLDYPLYYCGEDTGVNGDSC